MFIINILEIVKSTEKKQAELVCLIQELEKDPITWPRDCGQQLWYSIFPI